MDWFGDDWGADDGFGLPADEPVATTTPTQQAPIGHQTTTPTQKTQPINPPQTQAPAHSKLPISKPISKPVISQPVQASVQPTQKYEAPQQPPNTYGNIFNQEDWGDEPDYINIIQDTQQTNLPPQEPEQTEQKKEEAEVRHEEQTVVEPEPAPLSAPINAPIAAPIAAPKKDPARAPKPPAQAERNDLIMGSSGSKIMGSSGMHQDWGERNISNSGLSTKRRSNRRNEKPARNPPLKTQSVAPVAPQPPVGSATSKIQVTTDPTSVPHDDIVQSLMDKVHELEKKVEELENLQRHQFSGGVCTLNSTGKVNGSDLFVVWDSTNHIIRPQKGLKLVEPEKVYLEVSHRGLYQITFTTCGTNPQLIVNDHVYAAAKSAPARERRDGRQLSSTSCVNIYLYLDEKATIAGRVTDEIASENPCEHWMCVRLVHRGF